MDGLRCMMGNKTRSTNYKRQLFHTYCPVFFFFSFYSSCNEIGHFFLNLVRAEAQILHFVFALSFVVYTLCVMTYNCLLTIILFNLT
jgi:hypothetical protein